MVLTLNLPVIVPCGKGQGLDAVSSIDVYPARIPEINSEPVISMGNKSILKDGSGNFYGNMPDRSDLGAAARILQRHGGNQKAFSNEDIHELGLAVPILASGFKEYNSDIGRFGLDTDRNFIKKMFSSKSAYETHPEQKFAQIKDMLSGVVYTNGNNSGFHKKTPEPRFLFDISKNAVVGFTGNEKTQRKDCIALPVSMLSFATKMGSRIPNEIKVNQKAFSMPDENEVVKNMTAAMKQIFSKVPMDTKQGVEAQASLNYAISTIEESCKYGHGDMAMLSMLRESVNTLYDNMPEGQKDNLEFRNPNLLMKYAPERLMEAIEDAHNGQAPSTLEAKQMTKIQLTREDVAQIAKNKSQEPREPASGPSTPGR